MASTLLNECHEIESCYILPAIATIVRQTGGHDRSEALHLLQVGPQVLYRTTSRNAAHHCYIVSCVSVLLYAQT